MLKQELEQYQKLLSEVKQRIRKGQIQATMSANAEMLMMYWDIGKMVDRRQSEKGWGAKVIPKLSIDLQNDLPKVKGFSVRNIKLMTQFYREYPGLSLIGQRTVAQLENHKEKPSTTELPNGNSNLEQELATLCFYLPWSQNVVLMQKVKEREVRMWYMKICIENSWSRDFLNLQIKSQLHTRQGKATTNFDLKLPAPQSEMAKDLLKDPYIFDFLTLEEPFHERELETGLLLHLEKFLLELGQGFAFVGRQYHVKVGDKDFYIDLLLYHLKLRCFIVVELKKGEFQPEHAGKMNFYCSVVDDQLRHHTDNKTIGLILCEDKNQIVAEYALNEVQKPIGVSEYELTRVLPESLESSLPSIEEIEAELEKDLEQDSKK